jgi:metal-responsive CopG/Arc/MetJ family transcriptional regulator
MKTDNQKILISLPRTLVKAVDTAKAEKQVSRTAFIKGKFEAKSSLL